MKGKLTQSTSRARSKGATDFERLRALRDADIDFSDIPKLGKSFWKTARLVMPEPKERLTIRVDHDVVEWLKKNGPGYQTRINAILRSYMEATSSADRYAQRMNTKCTKIHGESSLLTSGSHCNLTVYSVGSCPDLVFAFGCAGMLCRGKMPG